MKSKELGLTFSHEQKKGLKELKAGTREGRIPTIQEADIPPYQGFYAPITAELIFKSQFVLLACTLNILKLPTRWPEFQQLRTFLIQRDLCLIQESTRPPAALGVPVPGESWCLEHPPAAPGSVSQHCSPYPAVGSPAGAGRACGSSRAGCTAPAAALGMECCQELAASKKKTREIQSILSSPSSWWAWEGIVYELRELRSKWIHDPWRAHRAKLHLGHWWER